MNKKRSKYSIVILLVIMFAAPGIAAYIFYHHPSWLGASRVNKGTLLTPAVKLNAFDGYNKWRITLWSPETCGQECYKQLELLARVRLALGRKLYQVDQWLILGDKAEPLSPEMAVFLKEHDVHVAKLSAAEMAALPVLPTTEHFYVANPDKYLILSYNFGVNPDDIYKDLKLLLNTAESRNG